MAPIIKNVKTFALGQQCPFSPSVSAEAGCLLLRPVFISRESLHCSLVGVNKSYVIATSDL